jgi:TonB family protein
MGPQGLGHVHVSESGHVLDARVAGSAGHELFDRAALRVLHIMRFGPAVNRDGAVRVWIELPIVFTTR